MRICLPLLLLADLTLAQPMPPDSVWVEPATWPDGEPGHIIYWTAVEGADGYRIFREILVNILDEDGNIVEREQPEPVLVPWGFVEPAEPVVEWMALRLDGEAAVVFAIATVQGDEESEPVYVHLPEIPRFVPPPPDSVWVEPATLPDGRPTYVIFWSAVEGAVGYMIYKEMESYESVDEDGKTIHHDEPQLALVPWVAVEATEPIVQWMVDEPDDGDAVFAIAAFSADKESEPVYVRLREIATAVRRRSWGQVKAVATGRFR